MASRINLDHLAYVHYQHADLEKQAQFLHDFGLEEVARAENPTRIYYSGTGPQPFLYVAEQAGEPETESQRKQRFIAGAFAVQSYQDLEKAAALPGASTIRQSGDPGQGQIVVVKDPNGFEIRLLFGQKMGENKTQSDAFNQNTPNEKPRKGEFVRVKHGPSHVHKLGHYGFMVMPEEFEKIRDWYTSTFNLKPTDSTYNPETQQDSITFLHIDKGEAFTDHHSFFIGKTPKARPHIHHASFEVRHLDDQLLGHDWLIKQGYTNCWGVGRHVLGSQIFDYWFDPHGNILEHYADGDVVNKDTPYGREMDGPDSLYVWGPALPLGFVSGDPNDANKPLPIPASA